MTLTFISRSGAVAGQPNAHELRGASGRLLFDCGAGPRGASYIATMHRPTAVWISHAHHDHCGGLFELLASWPRTTVLATTTTAKLLKFALSKGGAKGGRGTSRVEALVRRVVVVPWQRFRAVPKMEGVKIMALPAGHVPGAAMAVVDWDDGGQRRRVLYTGDFCTHDQAVVKGGGIPRIDQGPSMDAVICEAMLANDREADEVVWEEEARRLVQCVHSSRGPVVVGVGAIGESLEVATLLARAGVEGMIDDYLQGVFEVCRHKVESEWRRWKFGDRRRMRGHLRAGGVVVATGDQYRRTTTAGVLADQVVEDRRATIVVLNRAREQTGAGRLLASEMGGQMKWSGRNVNRLATVVHCQLINHAPRWQLEGFIGGVAAGKTLLVHGPTGSRWGLKRALKKKGYAGEVEVVERGERYVIGGR